MTPSITLHGELLFNEPMSRRTSLKVGGTADIFAIPESRADLQQLIVQLRQQQIPWLTIGRGYNLLVRDKGFRGAIISLERFNKIETLANNRIAAEAGAENLAVVRFAQQAGLGGISFISGIPGTIGGAVRMNAGAYGQGILEHTECLTILRSGMIRQLCINELDFGYRHLKLEPEDLVLAAQFVLKPSLPEMIEAEISSDRNLRQSKHNVGLPSAGSFFKNPPNQASWRLIDAAGMRGATVGGAMVSPVHSNFLVNAGGATAADFLELAARIKNAVFATSGVTLEEEVRIVGEI